MKTKILKVLPVWLVGLLLIVTIRIGLPVLLPVRVSGSAIQSPTSLQPEVLGASTSLGSQDREADTLKLKADLEQDFQ